MTAKRRWTIWLGLLAATLVAMVWVSQEPESDIAAPARDLAEAPAVSPTLPEKTTEPKRQAPAVTARSGLSSPTAATTAKAPAADPFAARSWYVAPPAPPPEPPARPTAPPLPFRYLGTLESGDGQWLVQLARGDEGIVAGKGEVIGDIYRLDGLEQGNLVFTYLPIGTRQLLPAFLDSD